MSNKGKTNNKNLSNAQVRSAYLKAQNQAEGRKVWHYLEWSNIEPEELWTWRKQGVQTESDYDKVKQSFLYFSKSDFNDSGFDEWRKGQLLGLYDFKYRELALADLVEGIGMQMHELFRGLILNPSYQPYLDEIVSSNHLSMERFSDGKVVVSRAEASSTSERTLCDWYLQKKILETVHILSPARDRNAA